MDKQIEYENYFVSPHNKKRKHGRRVQKDNAKRASKIFRLKEDAEDYAIHLASQRGAYITVQKEDGTVKSSLKLATQTP